MADPTQDSQGTCCTDDGHVHGYTQNKTRYLARLKRIEGQTRGIQRMLEEDNYCIDIITQISAATSALENVALAILDDHVDHCVRDAARLGGEEADHKIVEALAAIRKMVKS